MIRKLSSGQYRLYSRKKDPRTGKRRNLGTFATRAAAERHERAVQFFKRAEAANEFASVLLMPWRRRAHRTTCAAALPAERSIGHPGGPVLRTHVEAGSPHR
jgi:hypothetical protein